MHEKIELQVRARFGKHSGSSDYGWVIRPDCLPQNLVALCESLVETAASSRAFLALVTEESHTTWLVRVYDQGTDNAFRAVIGLEVAELIEPAALSRAQFLGLAAISIQQTERARIGQAPAFSFSLPVISAEPAPPNPELIVRARLGLPVSTTPPGALYLLAKPFWRYKGLCLAASGKGSPTVEWIEALAPYLGVYLSEPRLSPEDLAAVDAVTNRPPSAAEWAILDLMAAPQVCQALRWSVDASVRLEISPTDELMKQWLVAFRASQAQGASLLKVLRDDFLPHRLPPDVVELAVRGLSADAASLLAAAIQGEPSNLTTAALEELAQQGYLDNNDIFPLARWREYATDSPVLSRYAMGRLTGPGISSTSAAFILNLSMPSDAWTPKLFDNFAAAAAIAHKESVPLPRQRFIKALKLLTAKQLPELEKTGRTYGEWTEALASLITEGAVPQPGVLEADEMSAAMSVRQRLDCRPLATHEILSCLLKQDRIEDARALFLASQRGESPTFSPVGFKVVSARLGLGEPDCPPTLREMRSLVEMDLVRPADIDLGCVHASDRAAYAALWQETRALAALIENFQDRNPSALPVLPAGWATPVLGALKPSSVGGWLRLIESADRVLVRRWFAQALGVNPELLDVLCGETTAHVDAGEVRTLLSWVNALAGGEPFQARLRGLCNVASTRALHEEDSLAEMLVEAMLPEANEDLSGLLVHALSRVGPLPPVGKLAPDVLVALMVEIDPIRLIDQLLAGDGSTLSGDWNLIRAIVERVSQIGAAYPAYGYTKRQRQNHAELVSALGEIRGWEGIRLEQAARAECARRILRRLGVSPQSLLALAEDLTESEDGTAHAIETLDT